MTFKRVRNSTLEPFSQWQLLYDASFDVVENPVDPTFDRLADKVFFNESLSVRSNTLVIVPIPMEADYPTRKILRRIGQYDVVAVPKAETVYPDRRGNNGESVQHCLCNLIL